MNRRTLLLAAAFSLGCAQTRKSANGGMSSAGSRMVTIGTISRLGNVVVNGFEWDTTSARIVMNGQTRAASALRLGMVVRVEGTKPAASTARGIAHIVRHDADIIGPLQRIANAGGSGGAGTTALSVAGQALLADAATRFDGFNELNALDHNDVVEASGFWDHTGQLHATWIRRVGGIEALATDVRIKGVARKVKATQFQIGSLTAITQEKVLEGDYVAVTGKWRVAAPELAASSVQKLPAAVNLPENVPTIMEGLIRAVGASGFTMHNRPIVIRTATAFENGEATALHEGHKLHVVGKFRDGVFDAARVIIAATK